MYIRVQNELVAAYNFLRDRESKRLYGENFVFTEISKQINEGSYKGNEEAAKKKLETIQKMYPLKLSEAEPKTKGQ